jgi:topoisomerase IV subunit A
VENPDADWIAAVTNTGHLLIFLVGELPKMEKGKGDKIINIRGKKVASREEYMIGIAVFKEGDSLLLRTGKGELLLKSGEKIDHYVAERALRGLKLPKDHQQVRSIERVPKAT